MPRLPRNMVKKGKFFYFRKMVGGRLVRRSLGSDYQEACNRLRSLKDKPPPRKVTVEEAANRWLSSYVALHRAVRDQKQAAQRMKTYLVPCVGHFVLGRLTSEDCRDYRHFLERRGLKPMTVKHLLSDFRCLLNWCEEAGLVDRSPFPKKIMPRIQERPPDRLSEEELVSVCELPDPHGQVCRFLLGTGLRWSEAVRAQGAHVQSGLLVVSQTKSGKVRRVPVPDEFRGWVGRFVPFQSHGQFNRQVAKLSGVEGFHVHRLRHSFGCLWLEKGGSLAALQELLGHSTIVTTQRYARLAEVHVQAEAAKVGQLVPKVVTCGKRQNA